MDPIRRLWWCACFATMPGTLAAQTITDLGLNPHYAQTGWPGAHRDSRNSDFSPFVVAYANSVRFSILDGAAVLAAPVMGPEGNLYVTTGQGPGFSHLHAFDASGNLLWESAPQGSGGPDSWVSLGAPLVDAQGIVYVAGGDEFWAYRADGTVKWTAALPGGPMASIVLTNEGDVGGVTVNGKVAFFDRGTGSPAIPPYDLPAGTPAAAVPVPGGLWTGGLLDPAIRDSMYHIFLGRVFQVANTPAVNPLTGRIYIPAAGPIASQGVLYGLDIGGGQVTIAFSAPMGGGSGTSPAVSEDGSRVFAVDGSGVLHAFDGHTGAVLWTLAGASASASSPTVGLDGTVYTGGSSLTAVDPATGLPRWAKNFNWLASALLPVLPAIPPYFNTGQPVARTNGVVAASPTRIWTVLALGYEYTEPDSQLPFLQPRVSILVSIDPATGNLTGGTKLRDTIEGPISISASGSMYTPHAGFLASAFYYGLNQNLPAWLKMPGPPKGGFSALSPVSFRQLALDGIAWVQTLGAQVQNQLPGDVAGSLQAVKRGQVQLAAAAAAVGEAAAKGEIDGATAGTTAQQIGDARSRLLAARQILSLADPTPLQQAAAENQVNLALTLLASAAALLQN